MIMAMDQFLAEFYGTNGATTKTASQEDLEKQASVDLFLKLASEQSIDLSAMPDAQVQALYDNWVSKTAESEEPEKEEAIEEKAKKEHEEKKAYAEKVAEADYLGRIMAHSYVQELSKIAESQEGQTKEALRVHVPPIITDTAHRLVGHSKLQLRKGLEALKGHFENVGKHLGGKTSHDALARGIAAHAGGAAAVGGGAAVAHHALKKKEGSAIDQLGAEMAVYIANEGGFDPEQAGHKVASVLELGLVQESVKVAAAPDVDTAVYVRGLELLEAAGYPVEWAQ